MTVEPSSRVVAIKLGKLKNVEASGSGNRAIDGRRCFSMGSFDYVTEEASLVQVTVKPAISRRQGESLSVSKIWLRSKKERSTVEGSSRRVFSFRLPVQAGCEKSDRDAGYDVEVAGNVISPGEETPSFARRTLQWIAGWNQKTGSHSHSQSCTFPLEAELADGIRKEDF